MARSSNAALQRPAVWLAALVIASGCRHRERGVVRIAPGSTARDLHFDLAADARGTPLPPLETVIVDGGIRPTGRGSDSRRYLWYAARRGGVPDSVVTLREVRYGVEPPGMVAAGPTTPLMPGHYSVAIRAGAYRATRYFDVAADGRVR